MSGTGACALETPSYLPERGIEAGVAAGQLLLVTSHALAPALQNAGKSVQQELHISSIKALPGSFSHATAGLLTIFEGSTPFCLRRSSTSLGPMTPLPRSASVPHPRDLTPSRFLFSSLALQAPFCSCSSFTTMASSPSPARVWRKFDFRQIWASSSTINAAPDTCTPPRSFGRRVGTALNLPKISCFGLKYCKAPKPKAL